MDLANIGVVTTILLLLVALIHGVQANVMVTGTVFCDQCKDGQVSLFDYPLTGIKVSMACPGQDGQLTVLTEETTNWLGSYTMRFEGAPDMTRCRTQVSGNKQGCGAVAGPTQSPRLVFQMFDTEIYTVDHLISQPAQKTSRCPGSAAPPPLPSLPPLPPMPLLEASVCPSRMWTMPEHECYWRALVPDTKVAVVFGPLAHKRYGTDITLRQGLWGRADPYRTLLREATTALLNSYNSVQFAYRPLDVVQRFNWALVKGSTREILVTALQFSRANSGQSGNVSCKFTTCK